MHTDAPVFYSFRRCPYAMRARMALAVAHIPCRLREVVLRDKPEEMLAVSPKGTVPVLITPTGTVIAESLEIMMWALHQSDPGNWLRPEAGSFDQMQVLISRCDGPFKHALDRYKYPNRYPDEAPDRAAQRALAGTFLTDLETQLAQYGFLFGGRVSLADIAIFPFIRQFANTDRSWFDAQPWPHLQLWLEAHLNSARFAQIMAKYPQWTRGDAEITFPPPPHAE